METITSIQIDRSCSFRDACMDTGGRTMQEAKAEKYRMRGYEIRQFSLFYLLSPTLSRRGRGSMGQR